MKTIIFLCKALLTILTISLFINTTAKASKDYRLVGLCNPYIGFGMSPNRGAVNSEISLGAMFYNIPLRNEPSQGYYMYSPIVPGLEFEYKNIKMKNNQGKIFTNHLKNANLYLSTNLFRTGDSVSWGGFGLYTMAGYGMGSNGSNALSMGIGVSFYSLSLGFRRTQFLNYSASKYVDNSIQLRFNLSAITILMPFGISDFFQKDE